METLELKYRIALFLIARLEQAKNSYGLVKGLAWGFNIIEATEIIGFLGENQLINEQLNSNRISNFSLTELGETLIQKCEMFTYHELEQEYGISNKYVNALFPFFRDTSNP